jgi:hypothetical protein
MSKPVVIELYCACGDGAEGEIAPDEAAGKFVSFWESIHQGEGHRKCSKEESLRELRRREDYGTKERG